MNFPLLQLNRATVVREGIRALDGISLTIPVGRHTAIIGPNGSGKSTLVKLITRELYPLPGNGPAPIKILGHERWEVANLRSQLGIVSRDLEHTLQAMQAGSAMEVVLSGFFASQGIYKHHRLTAAMRKRAFEMLGLLGIDHLADKSIHQISSGEVRRVLIARALVPNPSSLLLDEPTTGLDMVARRRFLEGLRNIAREGKTIVLVTHHVEEVIPEIGWVILMKQGRVAIEGSKSEVLTAKNLSGAFGAPISLVQNEEYFSTGLEV